MPIRRLDKTLTATTATVAGEDIAASAIPVKPHIQYGVLQPAVAGKLLDGTTSHGATYGVAQSDGHSYYYTDIKGSKPIKDPRIGSHFGSQRHKTKSLQILEQETATHGVTVYSIDGREWMRFCGDDFATMNDSYGQSFYFNANGTDTDFIEVTGYFSDLNYLLYTGSGRTIRYTLDGGTESGDNGNATQVTPLHTRFVDAASLVNLGIGATLGIHTVKLRSNDTNIPFFGIELIAQDTTSTANKSKIQIPAQNVVSYGKKFALSAAAHHYNPFAQSQTGAVVTINSSSTNTAKLAGGWSGTGATYYSSELDTATSLGLSAWESGSPTQYYRPVNGGRVVWWVNSEGALKCSVNMMPPAGTAIGGQTSGHNVPTGVHNWATKYQPALYSTTIDHTQAEVAKTFHWREFGNGSANGNTNYADASMLNSSDDIAYVMDDGLTSLSGDDVENGAGAGGCIDASSAGKGSFLTFIGTGLSLITSVGTKNINVVQNLPYGTHVVSIKADASTHATTVIKVDGVQVHSASTNIAYSRYFEATFHQPKMPPIPEDACIIADYMLMADYVKQTSGEDGFISKGTRGISGTRDVFYNAASAFANNTQLEVSISPFGFSAMKSPGSTNPAIAKLPFFGTDATISVQEQTAAHTIDFAGSTNVAKTGLNNATTAWNDKFTLNAPATLGLNTITTNILTGGYRFAGYFVASPIHTSSHYQTFETPFLHELVGGDRNMEQNNLVVTADGKSWDEVTRDMSYISPNICVSNITRDAGNVTSAAVVVFDEHRGYRPSERRIDCYFKDFAYGYDRFICLVDGQYEFFFNTYTNASTDNYVKINGDSIIRAYGTTGNTNVSGRAMGKLKKGDYVQVFGGHFNNNDDLHTGFFITRLGKK